MTDLYVAPITYDNTLGVYDLALNRLSHDMVFPISNTYRNTEWDVAQADETVWDDTTHWDPQRTADITKLHSIWFINGADKVGQQIKMTLLAFLGEWFLDITFGVPYLEEILIKNPRTSTVESILRGHILAVPHVTFIESFAMEWDRRARSLSVTFVADTDYGSIKDSFKLEVPNV